MKKVLLLMLSACTMMFSSCDKGGENVDVNKSDVELSLSSASEVSFTNGDAIGVFAFEDQKSYAENAKYLYLNGDFKSSSPMKVGSEDLRYVATSPYVDGAKSQFTFSVAEDQSKEKDFEKSALALACKNMGTALNFEPAMATIKFTVPISLKGGDLSVTACGSVDCDLAAGTAETVSSTTDIIAYGDSKSYSVVVAPQDFEAGDDFLSLSVNGSTYSCEVRDDFSVAAGDAVTFNLKASGSNLTYVAGGGSEGGAFTMELVSTSYNDITVDITPNDFDGNYFVGISPVAYYENEFGGDDKLMAESTIYDIKNGKYEIDFGTPNGLCIFTDYSRISLGNIWGQYPDVDYIVFAVGVSSTSEIITDVSTLVASTDPMKKVKPVEITLDSVTDTSIVVSAEPGSNDNYMIVSVDKYSFEELGYVEPADFAQSSIDYLMVNAPNFNPATADGGFVLNGDVKLDVSMTWGQVFTVVPSTDYYVIAFSVSNDGFVQSDVNYIEVRTNDEEVVEGTISVEVVETSNFSVTVNTKFDGNIGRYMMIPFPKDLIEGFDLEETFLATLSQIITDSQGQISPVKADGLYILDEEVTNFDLSDAWMFEPGKEYVIMTAGLYATGELSTDLVTVEATTEALTDEQTASYNNWLGTWEMTSTTSYIAETPLTIEVVIAPDQVGNSYSIYGWDISAARWSIPLAAPFDLKTGNWSVINDNFMGYVDESTALYYSALSFVGGSFNDLTWISGDYPAFTSVSVSDKAATIEVFEGQAENGSGEQFPYYAATMVLFLVDSQDMYGLKADETLGFEEGETLMGPFTMKKISDETSNEEMDEAASQSVAPLKAQAKQSYFNIVERVVTNAKEFNAVPSPRKIAPVLVEKSAKAEVLKISADATPMTFSRKASLKIQ